MHILSHKKNIPLVLAVLMSVTISIGGCNQQNPSTSMDAKSQQEQAMPEANVQAEKSEAGLSVLTTIYPVTYLSQEIAGEFGQVESLLPQGAEPHDWEPSPQDIARLEGADILVMNGAGIELWVDDLLASSNNKDVLVVDTSKNTELLEVQQENEMLGEHMDENDAHHDEAHELAHQHSAFDPHLWLSPKRALQQAEAIYESFIKADEQHKEGYTANYEALKAKLEALDKAYEEVMSKASTNKLVSSHGAFAYLAHDYGLENIGIAGINADQEPSPQTMAQLIDFVKAHELKVIFTEEFVSPKIAEVVAKESGVRLATLYTVEALSEEDARAGLDYYTLMEKNLETLSSSLL
ncbi:MAG: zinc ABC transporter substrate-binding protein [Coriobacteriia bacterium]|nr:zinc ABC transporter substrate-binding protein [Coriobacteriia bacterium]